MVRSCARRLDFLFGHFLNREMSQNITFICNSCERSEDDVFLHVITMLFFQIFANEYFCFPYWGTTFFLRVYNAPGRQCSCWSIMWLRCFNDWLRRLRFNSNSSIVNATNHCVFNYVLAHLMLISLNNMF